MNAEQYLNVALGGNMNIITLKPLAWYEIMDGYARHKLAEAQPRADNKHSAPYFCNCVSGRTKPKIIVTVCPKCQGMLW